MISALKVRKFEPSDADSVIALWKKALPSSQPWNEPKTVICRKLSVNDGLFFVGQRDGEIIATVMAGYDGVRGWIYALAVAEEHRRRGIGRRLLEEAEKGLMARGCDKINLQVRATNSEVIEFYERSGFSVEDRASLGKPLRIDDASIADPVPTIQINEQITLSQISWEDKPAYLKHLNETDEFHTRMGAMPFPYREIDADAWISKVVRETFEADGRRNWAIRNNSGELIGGIGIFAITRGEKAETGYWLAKPYWGRGIVTDVVRRLCEFSFAQYDLQRLHARAFATNPASARVLEKAGFELEGTLRSHHFRDGEPVDVLCFGMLRPRWKPFTIGAFTKGELVDSIHRAERPEHAAASLTCRRASAADVPLLARMNQQLIEDEASRNPMSLSELEERMAGWINGDWDSVVVEQNGKPVGYILFQFRSDDYRPSDKTVYVRQFFIDRQQRSQGLGRRAFETVAAKYFPNVSAVVLEVLETNPRARRFWECLGFRSYCTTMRLDPKR